MWELELRAGDRVLLCSDGLSNEVGTDEMAAILRTVADPQEAAQRLVDVANEHGGADNITVVIVDVQVGARRRRAGREGDPAGSRHRRNRCRRWRRPPPCRRCHRRRARRTPGGQSGTGPRVARLDREHARCVLASRRTTPWHRVPSSSSATNRRRWRRPGHAATSSSWAPTSVPVARSTTRVPPPPSPRADVPEEGEPGRPPAPPGDPAPHHAACDRVRPSGGGGAGRGLLRAALVRLRQLDRDGAGQPDRGEAGPAGRRALVPSEGGGPDRPTP